MLLLFAMLDMQINFITAQKYKNSQLLFAIKNDFTWKNRCLQTSLNLVEEKRKGVKWMLKN